MLVQMTCPNCGANMEVDDSRENVYCTYCGTKIANMEERVHVEQNVNVSGTVVHKIDRSNEPTLYISYASVNRGVILVTRIVGRSGKYKLISGQALPMHLEPGAYAVILKIGKKNYKRNIYIPDDRTPVRITAGYDGRAQIAIDQPAYTPKESDKIQGAKAPNSGLSKAAFVCAVTIIPFFVAFPLAIVDLLKRKEGERHGLSIAALAIASVLLITAIISMATGAA